MRKLLMVVMLFAAIALSAQNTAGPEGAVKVEVSLELTEIETLQISIVMKDALLAAQQIQILQVQFQAAVARRNARQAEFDRMVERLRVVHEAPADKFTFDSATLTFVPIPPAEEEDEKLDRR